LGAVIAFTQYTAWNMGDYDIIRYYETYRSLAGGSLRQAFAISLLHRDVGFSMLTYFVTFLSPKDPRMFAFFYYGVTNLLLLYTYRYYNKSVFRTRGGLILFIVGIFMVINFFNSTNAYRQILASALFLVGTTRCRMNWTTFVIFAMSLLCHWSVMMFILPYLLLKYCPRLNHISLLSFLTLALGLLGGLVIQYFMSDYAQGYLKQEELGTDRTIMAIQLLSVICMAYTVVRTRCLHPNLYVSLVAIMLVTFLFITRSTILMRISLSWTQLFLIILPTLLHLRKQQYVFITSGIVILFMFYNIKMFLLSDTIDYMLFTKYGLEYSIVDVFQTPCLM
jgi:hypothetical protein